MQNYTEIKFLRKKEVLNKFGFTNSTLYDRIKNNLLPSSISLGGGSVAWLEHELNLIAVAMVEGKSIEDIKELVNQLESLRKDFSATPKREYRPVFCGGEGFCVNSQEINDYVHGLLIAIIEAPEFTGWSGHKPIILTPEDNRFYILDFMAQEPNCYGIFQDEIDFTAHNVTLITQKFNDSESLHAALLGMNKHIVVE